MLNFNVKHPALVESELVVFAVPDARDGPEILIRISRLDQESSGGMMWNSEG